MRTEPTTGVTTRPGTATCVLHEETYDHPGGSCPRCPTTLMDRARRLWVEAHKGLKLDHKLANQAIRLAREATREEVRQQRDT